MTRTLAIALVLLSVVLTLTAVQWPLDDFVEYWAAGRINASGRNPYDPAQMLQEERGVGWQPSAPDMMYNPPWTLALAMPLAAPSFHIARSIWLPIQLFVTLWCASELWMLYGGARAYVARACAIAVLWMPTLVALRMGQLSPVILLGLVGFLWALSRGRDGVAGVFFSLTAVKPQLMALVYVAFALWAIADRRWRVLTGATLSIVAASFVGMATNPPVFFQYQALMTSAPPTLAFESPNIATILRVAMGTAGSWPQFVPMCIGAAAVAVMWYRSRADWRWANRLPALVLMSCLLTSYGGWAFDLVVLLVPLIATAAAVVRSGNRVLAAAAAATFVGVSGAALAMHAAHVPQAAFLWMTPAVAASYYVFSREALPDVSPQEH